MGSEALAYYIFNYEGGGFSIISGDKRLMPILAYSDQNNFPIKDEYPLGITIWLENINNMVDSIRLNNIQPSNEMKALWEIFEKSTESDFTLFSDIDKG